MAESLTEPIKSVSADELRKCMDCPHNVVDGVIAFATMQYERGLIRSRQELMDISTSSLRRCGAHAIKSGMVKKCPINDKYGKET